MFRVYKPVNPCWEVETPAGQWKPLQASWDRHSHSEVSWRQGILEYFAKFTGKQPCRSLFLMKLQTLTLFLDVTLLVFWSYPLLFNQYFGFCYLTNISAFLIPYTARSFVLPSNTVMNGWLFYGALYMENDIWFNPVEVLRCFITEIDCSLVVLLL